jgi:hypothetical protein
MDSIPEINVSPSKSAAGSTTASLKAAGSLVAKKAERTKLVTVTLPRAYADLGKSIYKDDALRPEFAELFTGIDALLAQRKQINEAGKSRLSGNGLADKVRKAAAYATDMAKSKAIDLQAFQAFAKLGEAVYRRQHKDDATLTDAIKPIAVAVSRRDQLDRDTASIQKDSKGHWLTPKRITWGVGIFIGLGVLGLILDPDKKGGGGGGADGGGESSQKSEMSDKARKVIDSSKGLQIIESLGELDPEEVVRYAEMAVTFGEKGETFIGTTSENMLLLLMVPSAKWKMVAKKKGLSRQEYFFATNMIFIGMGDGYDPRDRSMHDARLMKVTGERLSDY